CPRFALGLQERRSAASKQLVQSADRLAVPGGDVDPDLSRGPIAEQCLPPPVIREIHRRRPQPPHACSKALATPPGAFKAWRSPYARQPPAELGAEPARHPRSASAR